MEEEVCLHAYFGYIWCHILLLDEPHESLITIEENASYHYSFERTSQHDIAHIISYYTYFGHARPNNSLHDVNGRPTRSTFHQDVAPLKFMRIDDEDPMPCEIAFYQDVIGEEILKEEILSTDQECDSLGDKSDPSEDMTSP
ncbi:hypothetical protein HKD37_18G050744 [Glycine soja]|nr:hypothetical protein GmHk_18G052033 [Glycine max]